MDVHTKAQIATILENQKTTNETETSSRPIFQDQWEERRYDAYMRCSLPIVQRIYDPRCFIGHDLISVQTFVRPNGTYKFMSLLENEWKFATETATATTRKLRTYFNYAPEIENKKEGPEYEVELIQRTAWEIAQEFNMEIIRDISLNAGTTSKRQWINPDELWHDINFLADHIQKKSAGWRPNWIVTSIGICNYLRNFDFIEEDYLSIPSVCVNPGRTIKIGKVCDFTLYEQDLFPNRVIMGFRDPINHYHSGYFYLPYIPISLTPTFYDPNFCPRPGVMSRYAKKLIVGGGKYYGRLDVEGIPNG